MEFVGREKELQMLYDEQRLSLSNARFTLVMGRRRIGKTRLIQKSLDGLDFLYIYAKNEAEETYCSRLQAQIRAELNISIYGNLSSMRDVFEVLFSYATQHHLNLVIDEVQDFFYVRKTIFADMQEIWDKYKDKMHINLIACGSIYSLMRELFEDRRQAMYGRFTRRIDIKGFTVSELKKIMHIYSSAYNNEDLLCFYSLTGGVPKYVETLVDNRALDKLKMFQCFCDTSMLFVSEGLDLMSMEFRKDSVMYYSILSLIAEGKTSAGEIESVIKSPVGAYLKNLELNYALIEKKRPILTSERSQGIRYFIADNYLLTWFKFIYPYQYLTQTNRIDKLMSIIEAGYQQFAGKMLERWFIQQYGEEGDFTNIGQWWDNKGENEIDMIALDASNRKVVIAEIKINKSKISLPLLEQKADKLKSKLLRYKKEFRALSIDDM